MPGILHDRLVLVTGAAQPRSIGEAIAARCKEEGARVIVTSRSDKAVAEATRRLGVLGAVMDLSDGAAIAESTRRIAQDHGAVDGVVHNAGFPVTEWARGFLEVDPEEYRRVFDVDVLGAIRLTRALLPDMVSRKQGSIIFTSSTAALGGYKFLHEFAPSKEGVLGLMRGLAAEFGAKGVRSNAVAYGNIASPATWEALTPAQQQALRDESPMGRWGEPREAAGASVFLLSDLASFVNGQVVVVDGGTLMR